MLALWVGLFLVVADQLSKEWIRCRFDYGELVPVIPGFFNLTYIRNLGAAGGAFSGHSHWLIVLSVAMIAALVFFRRSFLNDTLSHRIALGCMVGGIVGNLFDRVRLGYVTDFLMFYIGEYQWPSFNVADMAICTGVGLYILTTFLDDRRARRAAREAAGAPDVPAGGPAN